MKIAFLFGSLARGGAERMISYLANDFAQRGQDVAIVTLDNGPAGYALDPRVRHVKLNIAGSSQNIFQSIRRNLAGNRVLKRHLDGEKYDVVVTFSLKAAINLMLIHPLRRPWRVIASERANPRYSKTGRLQKLLRSWMLRKLDGFVFQTHRVSLCYPEFLREKGTVIPNGLFENVLDLAPGGREQTRIVAVGRLAPQKRYDVLLDAFQRVSGRHPDWMLDIYGEGSLRQSLQARCADLDITDKVVFHGSVPDVPEKLRQAGLFVMASQFEGMPNALMEAMALGLPCISTDCEFGPGELIENGKNGILVPVGDVDALADAMEQLLSDPAAAQKLGQNALAIRQSHTGARIAGQYYDYIRRITGK